VTHFVPDFLYFKIFNFLIFFPLTFPSLMVVLRRAGAAGHAVRWSADVH
jgi:hypothetical protein